MTITEALSAYMLHLTEQDRAEKTHKAYATAIVGKSGFAASVGDIPVQQIGIDHVVRWKLDMRANGLQPKYINTQIKCFRQLMRWLDEREFRVMDASRISLDKENTQKPHTILSPEEVKRLIDAAPRPRDKAIIALTFGAGCRASEVLELDRGDWEAAELVDKDEGVWEIYVLGKNKKYRPVCFFQNVRDAVDTYLETRSDRFKPLFMSQQNRRIHYSTVNQMIHAATREAGLDKRVTQHVLRHSYATEMGANGMPMPTLSYALGHANASITERIYIHINAKHSRKAYPKYHPDKKLLT